jgi:hypothetical protein
MGAVRKADHLKAVEISLRDRILGPAARPLRIIPVDTDHAGRVYVKEFSGADRDRAQALARKNTDAFEGGGWRGRLAAMYLCDEQGNRVFDPIEDADELNACPAVFLEQVITAGHDISGLAPAAVEAAKENFPDTPSDESTSESSES